MTTTLPKANLKEMQELANRPHCVICKSEDKLRDFKAKTICQACVDEALGLE